MIEAVLEVVREEFGKIPDGEQLVDKIMSKLRNTYANPPVKDFEFAVNKPFSEDEVRVALFAPEDEQVKYYSVILLLSQDTTPDHPLRKTASLLLTLIYLVHRKRLDFLQEFVIADGLIPLTLYLRHDNLYERSQALETFLTITDCDVYDWFQPPRDFRDQQLHSKMLSLRQVPAFLQVVAENREGSYPGGSFRALQLLAFWLSWVRALYTKDQVLQLSHRLLSDLQVWAEQKPNQENGILEEEIQLAKTLCDDFGQAGVVVDGSQTSFSVGGVHDLPSAQPTEQSSATVAVTHPPAAPMHVPVVEDTKKSELNRATALKEEGNKHYRAHRFVQAKSSYETALQSLDQCPSSPNSAENSDRVALELTLRSNLSNALWKLWLESKVSAEPSQSLLDEILRHCESALALHPTHSKCCYRLILGLLERHEFEVAMQRASSFLEQLQQLPATASEQGKDMLVGKDVHDDVLRFERLQRRCVAQSLLDHHRRQQAQQSLAAAASESESAPWDAAKWNVDNKQLRLLRQLLARQQLSHLVPALPVEAPAKSRTVEKWKAERRELDEAAVDQVAEDTIVKVGDKVDQVLNFMFEQRDDNDQTAALKIAKTSSSTSKSKDSQKGEKSKSKSKAAVEVTISSKDRKQVQDIRKLAGSLVALMLRAKSSGEDKTVVREREQLLQQSTKTLEDLLVTKGLPLKSLFFMPEEPDILLLVASIVHAAKQQQVVVAQRIACGMASFYRLQSMCFLFRMEYPDLRNEVGEILSQLGDGLSSKLSTAISTLRVCITD